MPGRVHLDRRGIRPHRRTRAQRPRRRMHPGAGVERVRSRRRGPARGGQHLRAVTCSTGNLVADVRHALEVSGLEPGSLVIELTESTIMQNTEVNLERFRELKALGVRLAIDDFGMGYSSLSYLHRFPDRHPEDRSRVRQPADRTGRRPGTRARRGDARHDARPRDGRRRHRERGPGGDPAEPRLRRGPGIPVCECLLARGRRRARPTWRAAPDCGRSTRRST